ncbi:hypothetical protein H632_c2911p0, partial [Helicosporidium sp. ATCC 50920]
MSYKDQVIIDDLSSQINVVVGANGSGKSNFFQAIRFVLNDLYSNLSPEDRQKLLHEGAGAAATSAYVELVLDNSDGRLPLDRDEVSVRRSISAQRDEYHVDKRLVSRAEVMNMLESAGFSRANPYYVVQQGKIMAMANMRGAERLELLKEIGGAKVYESRRAESVRLLREGELRRASTAELVQALESRLAELDAERAELAAFQKAERRRKVLERALAERELAGVRERLGERE